jgi:ankyrin repeat protein
VGILINLSRQIALIISGLRRSAAQTAELPLPNDRCAPLRCANQSLDGANCPNNRQLSLPLLTQCARQLGRYGQQENHMERSEQLIKFLKDLKEDIPSFEDADFSNINWSNHEGENALHIAVIRNEYDIAKELIGLDVEINARGDRGHTPLHEAASMSDLRFVKLLVESGADVHALTEGDPPFTLARYSKKDDICDYLSTAMKDVQSKDRTTRAKAQIEYLKRKVDRLEKQYGLKNP